MRVIDFEALEGKTREVAARRTTLFARPTTILWTCDGPVVVMTSMTTGREVETMLVRWKDLEQVPD